MTTLDEALADSVIFDVRDEGDRIYVDKTSRDGLMLAIADYIGPPITHEVALDPTFAPDRALARGTCYLGFGDAVHPDATGPVFDSGPAALRFADLIRKRLPDTKVDVVALWGDVMAHREAALAPCERDTPLRDAASGASVKRLRTPVIENPDDQDATDIGKEWQSALRELVELAVPTRPLGQQEAMISIAQAEAMADAIETLVDQGYHSYYHWRQG